MQGWLIRTGIGLWSRATPLAAANWLAGQFFRVRNAKPKDWEMGIPEADDVLVTTFGMGVRRWGKGPKVMLVHGWEGRFSQFAILVPLLVDAGFEVISLDPPGHGLSDGQNSNPVKFGEAIHATAEALGPFFAIIGHSMGAVGAVLALCQGTSVQRVALVSMPASLEFMLRAVCRNVGFGASATEAFLRKIDKTVGVPASQLDARRIAAQRTEPALIIHDRNDPQVPFSQAEEVAAVWPGARSIFSDRLGHTRILANTQICNGLIGFLKEQPDGKTQSARIIPAQPDARNHTLTQV